VAPATKELIDAEVRKIVDECYADALELLRKHRPQLDTLAHRLLEAETLDEDDAYEAAGIDRGSAPGAVARGDAPGFNPAPGVPAAPVAGQSASS
jgi:cell division protease FtsH